MVVAIVVVTAIGLAQGGGDGAVRRPDRVPSVADARQQVRGAPAALRRLYADGDALLRVNGDEFVALVRRLRGHPVVINKWASWCGPCRTEFPILRRAAADHGSRVAFVGLNSGDEPADARRFLRREPTLYPHVRDPDEQIASALEANVTYPSTIFLDAKGDIVQVKQGVYTSLADFERDLRRYAGARPAPGANGGLQSVGRPSR
ncbi:thiol:disulfide interchange protein [Patulibacter medicamentivorans]|uniref:Thiol:disulfide interchange protein n=1 Tax=Patulibacter medicamentivorans TaxID=1097667 RepID=H0E353_9ACTN|nr:thiol:disulfide interchange protein [Patulibacter medicamentivorans]